MAEKPFPRIRTEYITSTEDLFVPHFPTSLGNPVGIQIISEDKDAILMDLGHNRNQLSKVYATNGPSRLDGVLPLINYGIFPASLQEILRPDLPYQVDPTTVYERFRNDPNGANKSEMYARNVRFQSEIDTHAIVATHAHADHIGNIAAVSDDLNIITTPETYALMLASQRQGRGWYSETVEIGDPKRKRNKYKRNITRLTPNQEYLMSADQDDTIKLIPTSHWFGSTAVERTLPSGNRIMYTSDLNWGTETEEFASYIVRQDPYDLFILDATHFGNPYPVHDERELRLELRERFREDGPVYMMVNEMDMNRLSGILTAAHSTKRQVYIHPMIARQVKHMRDELGKYNRELPDPEELKVLHPPGEPQTIYDDSFKFATYGSLEKRRRQFPSKADGKRDVYVFSRPDQLIRFDNHGLIPRDDTIHNRLIVSTYGYNPASNGKPRYEQLRLISSHLPMEKSEYLSGHHMRHKRFEHFVTNYLKAETVVVFHTDPKHEATIKEFIETNGKNVKRVITNGDIQPEVPMTLNGKPLPMKKISYPK